MNVCPESTEIRADRRGLVTNETEGAASIAVDWRRFIEHQVAVQAEQTLQEVFRQFETTEATYFAVLDGRRVLGLCAREDIGMRLGSAYGFSLFHHHPVRECLLDQPMLIRVGDPWGDVLPRVFDRDDPHFWQDLILVDSDDRFLGLIPTFAVVKLQNQILRQTIGELRQKHREISAHNERMNRELVMARELQLAMFSEKIRPSASAEPLQAKGIRLDSYYAPLHSVSGDFFEVVSISDTQIAVLIGDVMGHGIQAALVTAMMRALVQTHSEVAHNPGQFLMALNRSFCEILESCHLETFATALLVVVDSAKQTVTFASAGHPDALHVSKNTGQSRFLVTDENRNGGPLGIRSEAIYSSTVLDLEPNDRILLYTDGLYEAEGPDGDILGRDHFMELAKSWAIRPGYRPLNQLIADVQATTLDGRFSDDVCLLEIQLLH